MCIVVYSPSLARNKEPFVIVVGMGLMLYMGIVVYSPDLATN